MNGSSSEPVHLQYGVEHWGAGYFEVSAKGQLVVRPKRGDARYADVKEIVDHLVNEKKLATPIILRFPQLLEHQLDRLHDAYDAAIREFKYTGKHCPVFPMKVNPRREVVEELLRSGSASQFGLECGSKAELYAALSLEQPAGSLLICNGFKDQSFIDLALLGQQTGKQVIVVLEKIGELQTVLKRSQETGVKLWIGLRAKLYSKGSGKWASSGGDAAKFGLTTSEILECIRVLKAAGCTDRLKLLHFHIGSQITDVRRVRNAVKEAARVYAKIRQMKVDVQYLDIGGGMGVDYDGSKTTFEASINYTMSEFANTAVYQIRTVCDEEHVPHPNIVTESGRVMTAYHSILITSIRDEIETFPEQAPAVAIEEDDPQVLQELKEVFDKISTKNYREYYHDALEDKDELHTQFNLGLISLEDRAKGEVLFWEICAKAEKLSRAAKIPEDEFSSLGKILASKYLCNFSVFRSAPDSWAIAQLFPVMPIHRLNEPAGDRATLVDVTCDSDGCIQRFVDLKDVKDVLEMPAFHAGEPYYLAIFLVGAYQDVMGSNHNLFGQPNEAHVVIDADGRYHIPRIVAGSRIGEMLAFAKYDKAQVWENFRHLAEAQVTAGRITPEVAAGLVRQYEADLQRYTYLE